jgi:CheY-like chemotaxis protein
MPKTIVWIEDDTDIIEPVVYPLKQAGYIIMPLHTVKEALDSIEQIRNADLLLLDMLLPTGNLDRLPSGRKLNYYTGKQLLEELRTTYHMTDLPVIVLSVVHREEVLEQLKKDLGVIDILRKPVRPSVLKMRVEEALESTVRLQVQMR